MPPRRGLSALALVFSLLAAAEVRAQVAPDRPPVVVPEVTSVVAEHPASDPFSDLMKRVNNLEGELKKSKEKELAKAQVAGKKPTINWNVQLQADGVWSGQDSASIRAVGDSPNGAAFRRARFNASGDYGPWEYKFGMDFALPGRPSFIDVFVGLNGVPGLGKVRVGHFFEPIGLEYYTQNRFITMLERSLPSEVLGAPRNLGVMANNTFAGERGTWALGVFRTESDAFGDDTGDDNFRSAVTGRVTGLAWYDEATEGRYLLHVGASYSARATRNEQVQFRGRPEIRIGATDPNIPYFVDTGAIPSRFYQIVNGELLWIHGPFSVQAEYQVMPVSIADRGAAYFQTWYALASVFLTGENRAYRKSTGVLDRVYPRRDFVKKDACGLAWGPGAWELAFRVSHADFNDGGVNGGRLTDLTFGVNWYLNPYVRMTTNYVHAISTPPGANARGGTGDFVGVRFGYEF